MTGSIPLGSNRTLTANCGSPGELLYATILERDPPPAEFAIPGGSSIAGLRSRSWLNASTWASWYLARSSVSRGDHRRTEKIPPKTGELRRAATSVVSVLPSPLVAAIKQQLHDPARIVGRCNPTHE